MSWACEGMHQAKYLIKKSCSYAVAAFSPATHAWCSVNRHQMKIETFEMPRHSRREGLHRSSFRTKIELGHELQLAVWVGYHVGIAFRCTMVYRLCVVNNCTYAGALDKALKQNWECRLQYPWSASSKNIDYARRVVVASELEKARSPLSGSSLGSAQPIVPFTYPAATWLTSQVGCRSAVHVRRWCCLRRWSCWQHSVAFGPKVLACCCASLKRCRCTLQGVEINFCGNLHDYRFIAIVGLLALVQSTLVYAVETLL